MSDATREAVRKAIEERDRLEQQGDDVKEIDNGGPAFPMPSGPEPRVNSATHYNDGMTLRDWFAGQALAGLARYWVSSDSKYTADDVAVGAVLIADAVIARLKGGGA